MDKNGKYFAHPMKQSGENQYIVRLDILNVQPEEASYQYALKVSNRDDQTQSVFSTKSHE